MAAGARVEDADGGGAGADDGAATEQQGDGVNQRLGELGEVGVGDLADLAVVPVGGAEQDSRGRVAVGDALDVHGYDYGTRRETMSSTNILKIRIYRHGSRAAARAMEGLLHGYENPMDSPLGLVQPIEIQGLTAKIDRNSVWNFGLEVIGTAYGLQTSPEVTLTHRQVTAGTSEACEYLRNWHTERHGGCSHLSGFPRAGTLIMSRRPKRADPGNFADAGIATHRVERRSDLGGQTSAVRLDVTAPPVRASIRMTLLSGFPLREKSAAL